MSASGSPNIEQKASPESSKPVIQKGAEAALAFFSIEEDKPIAYPEAKLTEVNQFSYDSHGKHAKLQAERDQCNHTVESEALRMGAAQYIATKPTQEDRMAAGTLSSSFAELTQRNKARFLKSIPLALNIKCKDEKFSSGAVMTMIIRRGNELHNINVGDCVAMVAYVKEDGEIDEKNITQINREHGIKSLNITEIPPPFQPFYVEDPTRPGKKLCVFRDSENIYRLVDGGLNLYQAIGDFTSEKSGLTHAGEYYSPRQIDTIKPVDYDPKKYKQRIFLSSDALKDSLPEIKECRTVFAASSKKEKYPRKIAQDIVVTAMTKKRFDNFTLLVSDSDPDSKAIEYFVVVDGHCNDKVSEFIRKNIHAISEHCLAKVVAQQEFEQKYIEKIKIAIQQLDAVYYAEIKDIHDIEALVKKLEKQPRFEKHRGLLKCIWHVETFSDKYQYLMAHSSNVVPDYEAQKKNLKEEFLRLTNKIIGVTKDFFVYQSSFNEAKEVGDSEKLAEISIIDAQLRKLETKKQDELLQFYFKHDPELSSLAKEQFEKAIRALTQKKEALLKPKIKPGPGMFAHSQASLLIQGALMDQAPEQQVSESAGPSHF